MHENKFSKEILGYLARREYRPQKTPQLARALGIDEQEYRAFRDAVKALMRAGRLVLGGSNALVLPEPARDLIGRFRSNPRGFGFVIPESPTSHGDLFVPPGHSLGAMTGDRVAAHVLRKGKRRGQMVHEGRIVRILERGHSQFVGELCRQEGRWFVQPQGRVLHTPIFVMDAKAKGAKEGDHVVLEIVRYPSEQAEAQGVITEVLGRSGEPHVDVAGVIRQHQLPTEFDGATLQCARDVVAEYNESTAAAGREDLRKTTVLTIDPDDARDFDDAISLSEKPRGAVELGVHIADVSYFVRPGEALDRTARERATSVYFPKHVIPMLPELLSNGLCSLQEGETRLTKSAFITYDAEGAVLKERFANTLVASSKRLTYRQASAVLEGKKGRLPAPVVRLLSGMETLARAIQERRRREGMLELDVPNVELVLDDSGRVVGTRPEDTSYSHKIIEMFMVEANEAVARLFARLGWPAIRRIHPEPDAEAGQQLALFIRALGLKAPSLLDRGAVQRMLTAVRGTPQQFAVNIAVLRSMQQAKYSPEPTGHYALASEHYTHFTSPIRRYPDLTIHRLLQQHLVKGADESRSQRSARESELVALGAHCSHLERRAEDAEREVRLVKMLRLLETRVGEQSPGVVTGVTNFGLYIQLAELLVEGLVRFADIADDWWEVDAQRGCVMGQRSGRKIAIGQELRVVISSVNVPARQLNLALAEDSPRRAPKAVPEAKATRTKSLTNKSPIRRSVNRPRSRGARRD